MNNYLTVPAHRLDSPTMSRARIGSGKCQGRAGGAALPAPAALGVCAVLLLLGSPWPSSPDHPHPTPIPSPRGLLLPAGAPSSLPSTIPSGCQLGLSPWSSARSIHAAPALSVPLPALLSRRTCCPWVPSLSIARLLWQPRFLLSCGDRCRCRGGCGAAAPSAEGGFALPGRAGLAAAPRCGDRERNHPAELEITGQPRHPSPQQTSGVHRRGSPRPPCPG